MACLYIERLKSNFQRAHHFSQRANNGEICWCPRSSIDRLCNYKCEHTPEATSNISVSVKFNPAAPKIFTIGLQPNYQHTSNDYLLVIAITELFKQYLAYFLQRYRSLFRSSSKLVPSKSCDQDMCSLNSLVSIVSKCSKEFAKNILDASKGSNHGTPRRRKHHKSPNERSESAQTLSRNIMKPDIPDEQNVEHRQDSQQSRQKMYRHSSEHKNEDIRSPSRTQRVVDRAVSSDRSNASGDAYSNYDGSPVPVAMRSICVQTSRNTKSRRKDRRKKRRESNRKENAVLVPTGMTSSQDIRTIFRTNSNDFNREESNLSLDLLGTRWKKTANTLPDVKGHFGRKELSGTEHSKSKENDHLPMIYQKCTERRRSVSTKIQTILTNKFCNNSPPLSGREDEVFLANSIKTVCDSSSLHEIVNVSQTSRDFPVEDKCSETIILGNIKKRLEEDYDDYFSFDEFDVFETWPKLTPKINQTSSDSTIEYYACEQKSETAAPLTRAESLSKYQRPDHSKHNFSVKSMNRNRKESLQANMTYSFSIHCTNSNLSHSQSSYYTPSQEQDVSPCSSVEYCSASNNSSSNFSRTGPNFNLLATLPPNACATYNRALETSPLSICDVSSKSNEIFPRSSERFGETMIRRHRSSSTKKFSKLITESFDSGVLTDYSRDHLLSSSERSRKTRRRYCAREPSSLPTYDFNSDSSYSDDSLNRRLEVAVKQFTDELVLTERKVKLKLRQLENPSRTRQYRRRRPRRQQQVQKSTICTAQCDSLCDFYWSHDDDKIASSSTPPILFLSDSEIDHI